MIQLNLLPDLKKEYIKAQKTKSTVIGVSILVTIGALGLSALLFVYVTFLQQIQINMATDDIAKKESQLQSVNGIDKYLTIQAQLAALPDLHNNKGSYDRLFTYLGVINPSAPNNVAINNLQLITDERAMILTGTTQSFETLNVFVDTLKNAQINFKSNGQGDVVKENMFEQVLIQSTGLARVNGQPAVTFTIKTIYNADDFNVQNTDVSASVPNITTTQSVTQSTQQIFNSEAQQ